MKYEVFIIESERGWGQRVDERKVFSGRTAKKDAEEFVERFNSSNTEDEVPDWYMFATTPKLIDNE